MCLSYLFIAAGLPAAQAGLELCCSNGAPARPAAGAGPAFHTRVSQSHSLDSLVSHGRVFVVSLFSVLVDAVRFLVQMVVFSEDECPVPLPFLAEAWLVVLFCPLPASSPGRRRGGGGADLSSIPPGEHMPGKPAVAAGFSRPLGRLSVALAGVPSGEAGFFPNAFSAC